MIDFDKKIKKIGGWLTKDEGLFLYDRAKRVAKNGTIVEIGSWKGRSTICLGLGSKDGNGVNIFAIDPHTGSSEHRRMFGKVDTYQDLLKNLKTEEVDRFITPLKTTSQQAVVTISKPIDLILIDGAHEYKFVKQDFELWFPKLKTGGMLMFHDSWHAPGVQYLTTKVLLFAKVKKPNLIDTLTIMEKSSKISVLDRTSNLFFVLYRLFFGWIGTLKINYFGTVIK